MQRRSRRQAREVRARSGQGARREHGKCRGASLVPEVLVIVRSVCVRAAVAAVLIMVACAPHGASEPPFPERDASAIRTVAATTTPSPESVVTTIEADTASVAAAD